MTKTAAKTGEAFDAAAFDASAATEQFRVYAEKGIEQSKQAYGKFKSHAETTQKALESSFETARSAGSEMSLKSVAAMRANAELGFSHFEAMIGAKSVSEMMELQTAYVRKSVELAVQQAKDFQSTSSKAGEEVIKPMKDAFEKSIKELEAA